MMRTILFVILLRLLTAGIFAAPGERPDQGIVRSLSEVKFSQDEDIKCLKYSLESGDPKTGPSTHILEAPSGCVVPWHHHTAEEQLVVIRGSVFTEMDGMTPSTLGPGGFAMMPSKKRHQFSCKSKAECLIVVSFNRPYDIFWDDEKEKH